MNIRGVGQLSVGPPTYRKRWFGLRRERIPESVDVIGWWIDDCAGWPQLLADDWDELVAAARQAGTYRDYREGTTRDGMLPESVAKLAGLRVA